MGKITTRRRVLSEILNKYSKYAPAGFSSSLKKQLKLPLLHLPQKRPHIIDLSKVKIEKKPELDVSKLNLGKPLKIIPPKQ